MTATEPTDRWRTYLFERHTEDEVRVWAKRLGLFRFCRAYGGHANDGDSLLVVYRYRDVKELRALLAGLGVTLVTHAERPPQPEPGKSYSLAEYQQFPSLIPDTQWIEQPGHCQIAGQGAFGWCGGSQLQLSISSGFDVTPGDVEAAASVERILVRASLERVDPPLDDHHCICPKYYPDYFL